MQPKPPPESARRFRCQDRPLAWVLVLLVVGFSATVGAASAVRAERLDPEAWITVRTSHFTVRSNGEPERAIDIARSLERFRAAFSQLAPELELRSPVPTRILAFRNEDSYSSFKSGRAGDRAKILGQFLAHRDGNFITLNADPKYLDGLGVIFHEYVHYLVQHNLPGVPRWFNEGLAEYYSSFASDDQAAVVGLPVERHMHWIRTHEELALEDLIESSSQRRVLHGTRRAEQAGRFYATSWGLVHYLLSGGEEKAAALADFFARLAAGEPPSNAFEEAFDLRLNDLEASLREYFLLPQLPVARIALSKLEASGGSGAGPRVETTPPEELLTILAELVLHQGQERRSETYFNLALDYEPEYGDAFAGLASVRDLQSRFEEAQVLFDQAYEFGPRLARSHLLYGRHLLTQMQHARSEGVIERSQELADLGRKAFEVASQVDPDFAEAQAMFGYSHLFGNADPKDGVAPLERARTLLPGRADIVFHLIQLRLRLGEFDRARGLAEQSLARVGNEEMLFRAREEIDRAELIRAANLALEKGNTDQGLRFLDEAIAVTTDPEIRLRLEADLLRIQNLVLD